jgi:AraC-like DNA-binding protein
MKAHFHMVPVMMQDSFSIRHDVQPNFGTTWHYHPELELHYVIKGEGIRFVGNNISNFSAGEMVLLGENLPHTWRCREEYFQPESGLNVEAIVIHFKPDCLGERFLQLPEAHLVPQLFEKARTGIVIMGKTREKAASLMQQALHATDLDRIILLLSILKTLAESTEVAPIALPRHFRPETNEYATLRLNKICNYTLSNYKKDITLEEISALSNLSVTSFCRYFKLMTKMTYYNFLTQIRISHACRLLIDDNFPANVICFECGFNNVSNYYRHFKRITGLTPNEYKQSYLHGIN